MPIFLGPQEEVEGVWLFDEFFGDFDEAEAAAEADAGVRGTAAGTLHFEFCLLAGAGAGDVDLETRGAIGEHVSDRSRHGGAVATRTPSFAERLAGAPSWSGVK